jgi:nucleotidyltransferase AbiEii toxin of type IV toxin-antitoxin system
MLLHELEDFSELIEVTAGNLNIDPGLVEKDYWIMHLWGLQQLGIGFELKGGTSLSKGHQLIHRFSEDIDILIHPDGDLPTKPNQNSPKHVEARRAFYDSLPGRLVINAMTAERDHGFDDERMHSAGIRLRYNEINRFPEGVKPGILLEAGFDQVAPNRPCLISSWAFDRAQASELERLTDNRAVDVPCYEPGYTLVEKLQTISTKFRKQQETGEMPANFMRHYYDVHCLLGVQDVQEFVGSKAYYQHKDLRFRQGDEKDLRRNDAFILADRPTRELYERAYGGTRALYYREQPPLDEILKRLDQHLDRL